MNHGTDIQGGGNMPEAPNLSDIQGGGRKFVRIARGIALAMPLMTMVVTALIYFTDIQGG